KRSVIAGRSSSNSVANPFRIELVKSTYWLGVARCGLTETLLRNSSVHGAEARREKSRIESTWRGIVFGICFIATKWSTVLCRLFESCLNPVSIKQFLKVVGFGNVSQCVPHGRSGSPKQIAMIHPLIQGVGRIGILRKRKPFPRPDEKKSLAI